MKLHVYVSDIVLNTVERVTEINLKHSGGNFLIPSLAAVACQQSCLLLHHHSCEGAQCPKSRFRAAHLGSALLWQSLSIPAVLLLLYDLCTDRYHWYCPLRHPPPQDPHTPLKPQPETSPRWLITELSSSPLFAYHYKFDITS